MKVLLLKLWAVAWGFVLTHPAFDVLVLWPLITGGINLGWKDASAYADTHPRWAPTKKLLQKYGVSPRNTIVLLENAAKARGLPGPADDTIPVVVPSIPPKS